MAYDSAVISFTTKTDKVDLVQAAHMNSVQAELVTIETILGTNVKGNRSNLKTRLNNALDADGSLLSGTAYPSPALASQGFFRTDLETYYVRNSTNTAWVPATGFKYSAGDVFEKSADTERSMHTSTYTLAKEIVIPFGGELRIKFDMKGNDQNGADPSYYGYVYKNGSPVGTEQHCGGVPGTTYATFSQDIGAWNAGDLCQLYYKRTYVDASVYVQNFRIYVSNPSSWDVNTD